MLNVSLFTEVNVMIFLFIRDVSAGDLLSRRKPVTQSTLYSGGIPEKAVDGNYATRWIDGSCIHTVLDTPSWWMLDLEQHFRIDFIRIFQRSVNRRNGLVVKVSDTSDFTEDCDQCGSTIYEADGPIVERNCPLTKTWQFVKITSPQTLNVCEVEVFGAILENAYFKTPTTANEFGCKFGLNESTRRLGLCVRCAMRCLRDYRCDSFQYDEDSKCQLQWERNQGEQSLRNTRLWNANRIIHSH
ncbi:fucolectin-1-like isoform X2 [Anneissia japonica]|uniref:fucolectin-1-like isoform X2 n=1 Tax=Anneissia japonica TaxID=1529436 RepID=UPI001425B056|nr:fucolectin-1-like isoform X2 [Anneissia japonica]